MMSRNEISFSSLIPSEISPIFNIQFAEGNAKLRLIGRPSERSLHEIMFMFMKSCSFREIMVMFIFIFMKSCSSLIKRNRIADMNKASFSSLRLKASAGWQKFELTEVIKFN